MGFFDDLFNSACARGFQESPAAVFRECIEKPINNVEDKSVDTLLKPLAKEVSGFMESAFESILRDVEAEKHVINDLLPKLHLVPFNIEDVVKAEDVTPLVKDLPSAIDDAISSSFDKLTKAAHDTERQASAETRRIIDFAKALPDRSGFFNAVAALLLTQVNGLIAKSVPAGGLDMTKMLGPDANIALPPIDIHKIIDGKLKTSILGHDIDFESLLPTLGTLSGMRLRIASLHGLSNIETRILYTGPDGWNDQTSRVDADFAIMCRGRLALIAELATQGDTAKIMIKIHMDAQVVLELNAHLGLRLRFRSGQPERLSIGNAQPVNQLLLDFCVKKLDLTAPSKSFRLNVVGIETTKPVIAEGMECPSGSLDILPMGAVCAKRGIISAKCPSGYEDMGFLRMCRNNARIEAYLLDKVIYGLLLRKDSVFHGLIQSVIRQLFPVIGLTKLANNILRPMMRGIHQMLSKQNHTMTMFNVAIQIAYSSSCEVSPAERLNTLFTI